MHLYVFLVLIFTYAGHLDAVEVSPPTDDAAQCMIDRERRLEKIYDPDKIVQYQGNYKIVVSPCFQIRTDQIPAPSCGCD